jgi:N-acetylglutamate synthase-like GNAT family acetyltransferase
MSANNYVIRKAVLSDLDAIKALADAHRYELGFVLRPAVAESIIREEVFVAVNDTHLIGFVEYHHRKDNQTTLYHLAIAPEWQQYGVGRNLIGALQIEVVHKGKDSIVLKCPEDLMANRFYQKLGFELITSENSRRRKLNVWRLSVSNTLFTPCAKADNR